MARKKSSKLQPAVTKLTFRPSPVPVASAGPGVVPGSATYYIDISQCASIVNRRFYRQGLNWAVSKIKLKTAAVQGGVPYPAAQNGEISISKLPSTWVMSNSWEKGMRHWLKEINETLEENGTESIKGKFLDFKIYADDGHWNSGFGNNLLPIDNDNNVAAPGEWLPSLITIPLTGTPGSATQFEIKAVGPNYNGTADAVVSLVNGYANSRALPSLIDPNVPSDVTDIAGATPENWLGAMQNEGTTQDIGTTLEATIQDQPPYPYENDGTVTDTQYPGGRNQLPALQIHSRELMTGTTVGNTTYLEGGTFPCGLMKIEIDNYDDTYQMQPEITVELVPGMHRGYLCEEMKDM
jgi:hypothetical protein